MKNDAIFKTEKPISFEQKYKDIKHEAKFTGLCINCDKRADCILRNDEYVIWHCEEYQ